MGVSMLIGFWASRIVLDKLGIDDFGIYSVVGGVVVLFAFLNSALTGATQLRKRLAPEEDPTTIMQPDEVSEVVCSLISDSGNCLDGQNIVIRKQR